MSAAWDPICSPIVCIGLDYKPQSVGGIVPLGPLFFIDCIIHVPSELLGNRALQGSIALSQGPRISSTCLNIAYVSTISELSGGDCAYTRKSVGIRRGKA